MCDVIYYVRIVVYLSVYVAIIAIVFTEEDKIAIKFLRENKHYGAKRFLAEFPSKPMYWIETSDKDK